MDGTFILFLFALIKQSHDRMYTHLCVSAYRSLRYSALYVGDLNLQAFLCVPGFTILSNRTQSVSHTRHTR